MDEGEQKPLALFLCTGNSARSQMGESILRARAAGRIEAASAGLDPRPVHALTLRVLEEVGLPTAGLRSKHVSEFLAKVPVRYAIVVCQRANESCPRIMPFVHETLYWPFDDPASATGTEEVRLGVFRAVRDQIENRIVQWLDEVAVARG